MNALALEHEAKRVKNAVKIRILTDYLKSKLEDIGEGNLFVGKYFPEEVIFADLGDIQDSQLEKIHEI
ncbi:hypothetical protein E6Q11_03550 [Candidatus Dojkabacteria bacterium]|uniref:Uncharacterized protein n=1 Tax=Candidatus Dojkabacteria bacterium TaxID=2099670 RepID=A0A5C7J610_9BACT|nr:MAG: hypothetical protein E6Q11_03550 [Candidatus Dojkabacteria bacterium]